jgi:hypothetical protein
MATEGPAHRTLLGGEQPLVESSDRVECWARAEEETSARQSQYPVDRHVHRRHGAAVEWQAAVETDRATAADRTLMHRPNGRTDHGFVHDRVGIDKHEKLATRLARPGVSGRGDLPVRDRNHPGSVLTGRGSGAVAGCIIHNHDLERLADGKRGIPKRA